MKNPVAKNCRKFNKAKKFEDRKKLQKAGYEKHKKRYCKVYDELRRFCNSVFYEEEK